MNLNQKAHFAAGRGTPEWPGAWEAPRVALAGRGLGTDRSIARECAAEVWRYSCSGRGPERDCILHGFRRGFHPVTPGREYLSAAGVPC